MSYAEYLEAVGLGDRAPDAGLSDADVDDILADAAKIREADRRRHS